MGTLTWILIIGLGLIGASLLLGGARNRRLDKWARTVPFTETQQLVMWELWQASEEGRIPTIDPLAALNEKDREYIMLTCSAAYRPKEFGSGNVPRMALFNSLREKGYTKEHAAVIVGMTFNRVGRKDLLDKVRTS